MSDSPAHGRALSLDFESYSIINNLNDELSVMKKNVYLIALLMSSGIWANNALASEDFRTQCLNYSGPALGKNFPVTDLKSYFIKKGDYIPLKIRDVNSDQFARRKNISADMCLLKMTLGPGFPGDVADPSYSKGIGIEMWVPSPNTWNNRYMGIGQGGFAGGNDVKDKTVLSAFGLSGFNAVTDGFLSASYDAGHGFIAVSNGSFGLQPNGAINWKLLQDWAYRGLHGMAEAAKKTSEDFYGKRPDYSYWNGASTGGREGLMLAQKYPKDYNGIISAYPAINWPSFAIGAIWPQIVMKQDLGYVISSKKLEWVTQKAITSCDTQLTSEHDGYISDIQSCRYDPLKDSSILCDSQHPKKSDTCLTLAEAHAINKIWFGPTIDGSYPNPEHSVGLEQSLALGHLWYGYNRGAILYNSPVSYGIGPAGDTPFTIGSHWLAITAADPSLADETFVNKKTLIRNHWKNLTYSGNYSFNSIFIRSLQQFSSMNATDNVDLREFEALGGKMIHWHGLADNQIPVGGSINYYSRVVDAFGGLKETQNFYRFYLAPGLGHGRTGASGLNPPVPGGDANDDFKINSALMLPLRKWVEEGVAPNNIETSNFKNEHSNRPWCLYPKKLVMTQSGNNEDRKFGCI